MSKYRVSADIGGTFTDIVVEPSDGPVFVGKVATTSGNPAEGVINGIQELIPQASDIEFFVHGTTVGLNAFLERKGERVLLIMTQGVSDSYTIARGNRQTLYQLQYQKPEQLVKRSDVHEIRGRLSWDGREKEPLELEDLGPVVEKVKAEGIQAIAVCLLHSYAHPQHEVAVREALQAQLPGVSISLSHEIAREWREYERASSAVMSAYVAPVVQRYLNNLQDQLVQREMRTKVHIMQSSGGVTTADKARENPVFTLLSGPVGGTIAGTALSRSSGRNNLLCVDMGGTSFDLSLVINGQANTTLETELEGLPLLMSIVDIETIGTGGGSIAWLQNGAMRVGPHSAGSIPGPACYGRGGKQPTVTDANLYLGRLGGASLLSGAMQLDSSAAQSAVDSLAAEVNMDGRAFAEGILAISNAAMADAMRTITVSQGLDPREFTLVAFGGAGPMAAVFLAEELDIGEVLIPQFPGTFSAWGMLQTDLRHDFTQSYFRAADAVDAQDLQASFSQMEAEGSASVQSEGIAPERITHQRTADMRYVSQEYSINVAVPESLDLNELRQAFHETHEQRYGHSNPAAPVEFVNLRVASFGAVERFEDSGADSGAAREPTVLGERTAVFNGQEFTVSVLSRESLATGFEGEGPAILEEQSATTVVPPGWKISVDEGKNVVLSRRATS